MPVDFMLGVPHAEVIRRRYQESLTLKLRRFTSCGICNGRSE